MLLIVSREQHALYEYFRWGFSASSNVHVIRDRRQWTRRQGPAVDATAADQRQADRRRLPQVRGELVARGFVIAR